MENTDHEKIGHSHLSEDGKAITHNTNEQKKYDSSRQCIKESKIDSNGGRNNLFVRRNKSVSK